MAADITRADRDKQVNKKRLKMRQCRSLMHFAPVMQIAKCIADLHVDGMYAAQSQD
jgi:hypothetical protein